MFFELLLTSLFAVILVRVLASIKMATEHAVAHWNQVAVINEVTSKGTYSARLGENTTLRRSARIQAKNLTVSPRLYARRRENKEKA